MATYQFAGRITGISYEQNKSDCICYFTFLGELNQKDKNQDQIWYVATEDKSDNLLRIEKGQSFTAPATITNFISMNKSEKLIISFDNSKSPYEIIKAELRYE